MFTKVLFWQKESSFYYGFRTPEYTWVYTQEKNPFIYTLFKVLIKLKISLRSNWEHLENCCSRVPSDESTYIVFVPATAKTMYLCRR